MMVDPPTQRPLSVFGVPKLSSDTNSAQRDANTDPQLEWGVKYINYLPCPVTVGLRLGANFTLPSQQPNEFSQCLVMRLELVIPSLVNINAHRLLSVVHERCTAEVSLFKRAYAEANQQATWNKPKGLRLRIEYEISLEELQAYGGTVYFHDVDTLVSLDPIEVALTHPYSEQAMREVVLLDKTEEGSYPVTYAVKIVDNLGRIGDRYVKLSKQVHRVPAVKDPSFRDGVYWSYAGVVTTGVALGSERQTRMLTIEEAEMEMDLFKSPIEAMASGEIKLERERELADKQFELEKLKTEAATDKVRMDRETAEFKAKLDKETAKRTRLEAQLAESISKKQYERDLKSMREKERYESRSYARKDSSEGLKFVPAIVAGIGAVFLALKAFL